MKRYDVSRVFLHPSYDFRYLSFYIYPPLFLLSSLLLFSPFRPCINNSVVISYIFSAVLLCLLLLNVSRSMFHVFTSPCLSPIHLCYQTICYYSVFITSPFLIPARCYHSVCYHSAFVTSPSLLPFRVYGHSVFYIGISTEVIFPPYFRLSFFIISHFRYTHMSGSEHKSGRLPEYDG